MLPRDQELIQQIKQLWKEYAGCNDNIAAKQRVLDKIDVAMKELSTIPEGTK